MTGFECPTCARVAPWTDGQSMALGDDVNEFWCQTCGTVTELDDATAAALSVDSEWGLP